MPIILEKLKNLEDLTAQHLADLAKIMSSGAESELTNGDFSSNTDNWIATDISNFTVTSGIASATATAINGSLKIPAKTLDTHKYYFAVRFKSESSLMQININGGSPLYHSGSNEFEIKSEMYTAVATADIYLNIADKRAAAWTIFYIDWFIWLDLTKIFGAGNEPSATDMDRLLSYYPNSLKFNNLSAIKDYIANDSTSVKHSLATAVNDFLVASGIGAFVAKSVAEVKTILGLKSAAYSETTAFATAAQGTKADNAATATDLTNHTGNTTTPHGATSDATANKIIIRDANGRAKVSDPAAALDIANKQYVDLISQGLSPKLSCRAATTGNISLTGEQTIDGVAVIAGDRVLVKNQTTASQNGIYIASTVAWTRAPDADTSTKVLAAFTFISEGIVNADSGWFLMTNAPITLNTTNLEFTQFSGAGQIIAGAGLSKTGNQLDVLVDGSTLEIVSDMLRLKDGGTADTKIGNRTVDQAITTTYANTGTLTQILSWIVKQLKALLGTTNWYTAPPTTLTAAKSHIDAAAPHSGHINHALATAANDFLVGTATNTFVKKTLSEVKLILGLGSAAFKASTDFFGNSPISSPVDPNSAPDGVSYFANNANAPSFFSVDKSGTLYQQSYSSGWVTQIAVAYNNIALAVRLKQNSTWTAWYPIWTSGNDGSGSGSDADMLEGKHGAIVPAADQIPIFAADNSNTNGSFYRGTTAPTGTSRLNYSGDFYPTRCFNAVYNDYAEYFERSEETEPGDIIQLNQNGSGYIKAEGYASKLVRGVHSDTYGHIVGGKGDDKDNINFIPVGLVGRVKVKIWGVAKRGQYVISSYMPGIGVATDEYIPGSIIGFIEEDKESDEMDRVWMFITRC